MKLTKRGEFVAGMLFTITFLAIVGFAGWIEGGAQ